MKRFAIIFPLLLLLCFAPQGRAANYYWGGGLGLSVTEFDAFELTLKNAATYRPQTINLKHSENSTVFGAAFVYGLDFGWAGSLPLRLELESAISGGSSASKKGPYPTPQGQPGLADVEIKLKVNWAWFTGLNLWLDIPVGGFPVKPYLGGGLGYKLLSYDADIVLNPNSPTRVAGGGSATNSACLYKLGGGARLAVGKRTFLDLGLRYAKKRNWSVSTAPFDLDFSSRATEARLGLRYYF